MAAGAVLGALLINVVNSSTSAWRRGVRPTQQRLSCASSHTPSAAIIRWPL